MFHRRPAPLAVAAASVVVVTALVAGCADEADGGDLGDLDPETTAVEFRFRDSSVPPEYHRSYTLTVDADEVRMVVDVYGDELHDVTAPVDAATWDRVLDRLADLGRAGDVGGDCDGGTSSTLRVTDGDAPVLEARVAVCGGEGAEAADRLRRVVDPARDLVDADALLATD